MTAAAGDPPGVAYEPPLHRGQSSAPLVDAALAELACAPTRSLCAAGATARARARSSAVITPSVARGLGCTGSTAASTPSATWRSRARASGWPRCLAAGAGRRVVRTCPPRALWELARARARDFEIVVAPKQRRPKGSIQRATSAANLDPRDIDCCAAASRSRPSPGLLVDLTRYRTTPVPARERHLRGRRSGGASTRPRRGRRWRARTAAHNLRVLERALALNAARQRRDEERARESAALRSGASGRAPGAAGQHARSRGSRSTQTGRSWRLVVEVDGPGPPAPRAKRVDAAREALLHRRGAPRRPGRRARATSSRRCANRPALARVHRLTLAERYLARGTRPAASAQATSAGLAQPVASCAPPRGG